MPDPNAHQVGQLSSTPTQGYWGMSAGAQYLYEFTVGDDKNINLSITDVVGDVHLSLYKDNGDGLFSSLNGDKYINSSDYPVNRDEAINAFQGAGRYFALIWNNSLTANAYFEFDLSATKHTHPGVQEASNLLPIEHNIGTLDYSNSYYNSFTQHSYLNNVNTDDTYSFHLDKTSFLSLILQHGNNGDADVRLGQDKNGNQIIDQDQGEILYSSNAGLGLNDVINQTLAPGDYFVQVYKYSSENIQVVPNLTLKVSNPS